MIYSRYLTYIDASKILGTSIEKIYELISEGKLEVIKFSDGDVRILIESVIQYKKRQGQ